MLLGLFTAFFLDTADKALGTTEQTRQKIAVSDQLNREGAEMMNNITRSTNEIWNQLATGSFLTAESMKNDNLRRAKKIESERREILKT